MRAGRIFRALSFLIVQWNRLLKLSLQYKISSPILHLVVHFIYGRICKYVCYSMACRGMR